MFYAKLIWKISPFSAITSSDMIIMTCLKNKSLVCFVFHLHHIFLFRKMKISFFLLHLSKTSIILSKLWTACKVNYTVIEICKDYFLVIIFICDKCALYTPCIPGTAGTWRWKSFFCCSNLFKQKSVSYHLNLEETSNSMKMLLSCLSIY